MPVEPPVLRRNTSTMNRRRHLEEIEANSSAANVEGMKKILFRALIVIAYFLICLYLPAIFG